MTLVSFNVSELVFLWPLRHFVMIIAQFIARDHVKQLRLLIKVMSKNRLVCKTFHEHYMVPGVKIWSSSASR